MINAEFLGLAGGFIPPFGVNNWNVVVGLGLSVLIGCSRPGHTGDDGVAAEESWMLCVVSPDLRNVRRRFSGASRHG
jgi:hypothetical protein